MTHVSPPLVSTQEPRVPRHSGRVVTQPERFIGLGEVPEDPKTDSSNYNEDVQTRCHTMAKCDEN